MQSRTSLGVWRASFLAALGLYPLQSLVACSSDTESNTAGTGGTDSGVTGTGGSTGGHSGTAGAPQGGSGGNVGTGGNTPDASNTSGGAGGRADAAAGGADSAGANQACKNPQPILVNGQSTGFVRCDSGSFHRTEKKECPTLLPRTVTCGAGPVGDAAIALGQCNTDRDCTQNPNGFCQASGVGIQGCFCNYGCRNDSDCPASNICACAAPIGQCVAVANCTVDSDCGTGLLCLGTKDSGCSNVFACQTKDDTCAGDSDCNVPCNSDAGCVTQVCSFVVTPSDAGPDASVQGTHQCQPQRPCATGRPFLVGGLARVATTARRTDWTSSIAPDLEGLDGDARAALATHYTEVALMEHASIAAFARFALDLLALGAPPDLVADTYAAMADETVHARDAFALASAYAGRPVGPGRLAVDNALGARGAFDVVETAILEGCIGETVAAIEATEALSHTTDSAVRTALERVVRDETRHAELAWRFVRWALESAAADRRRAALDMLERVVAAEMTNAASEVETAETPRRILIAHGALDAATRRELRRRVIREVVAPCARALADSHRASRPSEAGAAA